MVGDGGSLAGWGMMKDVPSRFCSVRQMLARKSSSSRICTGLVNIKSDSCDSCDLGASFDSLVNLPHRSDITTSAGKGTRVDPSIDLSVDATI